MMGKTHVSIGIATALLATQPTSYNELAVAITGGAIGGVLPDLDVRSNPRCRDALYARYIVLALVTILVAVDFVIHGPINSSITQNSHLSTIGGVTLFIVATLFGRRTRHRTFTHSVLGFVLFCIAVALVCLPLTIAFAAGFLSHLVLDLLNKQKMQIFYPLKKGRFCLNIFYANGTANTVFLALGLLVIIFYTGILTFT